MADEKVVSVENYSKNYGKERKQYTRADLQKMQNMDEEEEEEKEFRKRMRVLDAEGVRILGDIQKNRDYIEQNFMLQRF